ncbi:hypothetical protein IW146_007759, partial [Coemansia sp. RSA 922]
GADIVYDHVVEPYLIQNEDKLDNCFRQAEAVAQRSSSSVSKTAYDKWIGYVQRAINQQNTQPSAQRQSSETSSSSGQPSGLTGLLRTVSQKIPQASAAATYLAGFSGVTEGPPTQADTVGKSYSSMLTTWVTAFSSNSLTRLDDDEQLRDIRMRKSQLQDMVSQLETNERAIVAKNAPQPPPPQQPVEIAPSANAPREVSGFEEDVVMVGDAGMESSSEAHHDSAKPLDEPSAAASGVAKSPSSTSRRWFW